MKKIILIIAIIVSGCNNMLINKDIKAISIENLNTHISPHLVKDPKIIMQIVSIINSASKEPVIFKANLQLKLDDSNYIILVNSQYFKYQGITYRTDLDFEKFLNKLPI